MNKTLFERVKAKCKDTGLSEKYLITITEKMGGSIEDDSTDETAIENMANQIADIAGETQGEATRWANKKKETKKPKSSSKKDDEDDEDDEDEEEKGKKKSQKGDPNTERMLAMEKELAEFKAAQAKNEREGLIKAAQAKHKIPDWLMKRTAVPDDADVDQFMTDYKNDLIINKLMPADTEGSKAASEKALDEVSDSLLESITVK